MTESNLITVEQFTNLAKDEQIDYLMTQFHLQDHYLIGRIGKQPSERNFFFIEQLVNPYTGRPVSQKLFSDISIRYSAFCHGKHEQYDVHAGDLVLFQFSITSETHNIKEGKVLNARPSTFHHILDAEELLAKLDLTIDEIMGHSSEEDLGFKNLNYITGFYDDLFQAYFTDIQHDLYKEAQELDEAWEKIEEKKKLLTSDLQKLHAERNEQAVKLEQDKQKVNKEIERALEALHKKQTTVYNELRDIDQQVQALGFSLKTDVTNSTQVKGDPERVLRELPESEEDLIHAIQAQIAREGLFYERDTIRQFYSALKTNQFVILSGSSGTGKTSLISAFAQATSSLAKVIPVQPSWTDKQDLLGYYNPLDKQYVPSALLDAMMEAKENPDRLYLICLDELNLAQIEYYFADILSLREQKGLPLELYSEYEYEQNLAEIRWFLQKGLHLSNENKSLDESLEKLIHDELNIDTIDQFRYTQRYNNLKRYNWSLFIPENVRFIGTMNIDGTVRPLSPKVVDRSFIIPLELQSYDGEVAEEAYFFDLPYAAFSPMPEIDRDSNIKTKLKEQLYEDLRMLDASFNARVENHLDAYIAIAQYLSVAEEKIYDELILLKLLPRIEIIVDLNINVDQLLDKVQELCGEDAASVAKIKSMIEKSEQSKIFSYWS